MPTKPRDIEFAGCFLSAVIPVFLLLARWMKEWPRLQYLDINGGFGLK